MKRNNFLKSLGLLAAGIVTGNKIFGEKKVDGVTWNYKDITLPDAVRYTGSYRTTNVSWSSCTITTLPKNPNKFISEYHDNNGKLVARQKVVNRVETWKYFKS